MTAIRKTRVRKSPILICAAALLLVPGCGDDDFKNDPRAAVPTVLTGVIKPREVIIAPDRVGAGPIEITISNQTDEAHTVTLEGASVEERVGPVNPQDTARIQKTLDPGRYEVRAGADGVKPAELRIGRRRAESNERLLLP